MQAIVQVSGGIDSAAALIWSLERFEVVKPVFYAYGQPYLEPELKAAVGLLNSLWARGASRDQLLDLVKTPLPLLVQSNTTTKEYVPYRNLVLTAHSISLAAALHYRAVIVGSKTKVVRPNDPYSFRDSSRPFFTSMNKLVALATEPAVQPPEILMPLVGWNKTMVVDYLHTTGAVDTDSLWTCYGKGPKACGTCYHCKEYQQALKELEGDSFSHRKH